MAVKAPKEVENRKVKQTEDDRDDEERARSRAGGQRLLMSMSA